MQRCCSRPEIGTGSITNGLPHARACRYVMIASSPASKTCSRSIALNPSCAGFGPQYSRFTRLEVTRPSFIARVTGASARFVLSVTTPVELDMEFLNAPHSCSRREHIFRFLDGGVCTDRRRHDQAVAVGDHALDVARGHVRMADRHVVFPAGGEHVIH